jgi:hypothetical protein
MRTPRLLGTIVGVLLLSADFASAQGEPRGYAAIKAGANVERGEDNLHGTSGGIGVVAAMHLSTAWALEGEFWYPGAINTNPQGGRHRDTLLGANLRWSPGSQVVRPHLLLGLTVAQTRDELTLCFARRTPFGMPDAPPSQALVSCDEPDVVERQQDRFSSLSLVPLVGAGIEIPVGPRMRILPDIRVQVGIGSIIVRPAIAFGIAF